MDISTFWSPPDGRGDWAMAGADLSAGQDLATAVLISLFTDARADDDDVLPDGSTDRRGWWGNTGRDVPVGSKLWLLERRKATEQTRQDAQDYASAALAWLVQQGVAAAVKVTAAWVKPNWLGLLIEIDQPGGPPVTFNYQWAWAGVS